MDHKALITYIYIYIYNCWKKVQTQVICTTMVSWIIPIVRQSKTDLIHWQEMRLLRHGGSHFVKFYIWLEFGTFFNNYSNHPRMCVLSTLCGNVDKHSPFDIYIYIYIYCPVLYCKLNLITLQQYNWGLHGIVSSTSELLLVCLVQITVDAYIWNI